MAPAAGSSNPYKASSNLEQSYRVTYDEIEEVKRSLNDSSDPQAEERRQMMRQFLNQREGDNSVSTHNRFDDGGDEDADEESHPLEGEGDRRRIQQFKEMLADRRATALQAFSATDEHSRSEKLKEMLNESRTAAAKAFSAWEHEDGGVGAHSFSHHPYGHTDVSASQSQLNHSNASGGGQSPHPASVDTSGGPIVEQKLAATFYQEDKTVYDRLIKSGVRAKLKQEAMRRETKREESKPKQPKISKNAAKVKRQGTVYDVLMKRQEEYNAKLEMKRKEKEEKEKELLKNPKINKQSARMQRGKKPVEDRLVQQGQQTMAKREQMKKILLEKEGRAIKEPKINPVSERINRSADMRLKWEAERERKLKELQTKKEKEVEANPFKPSIAPGSEKLLRNLDRSGPVEDRLHAEAEYQKHRRREMLERQKEQESVDAVPMISVHSANLVREGDIAERLYNYRHQLEQKKVETEERLREEREPAVDPTTGAKMYSPKINATPRGSRVKSEKVEERLLQKGEDYKMKKSRALAEDTRELKQSSEQTTLGPYSKLLVDLLEQRTQSSTMERLQKPLKQLKKSTIHDLNEEEKAYTFQPQLNSRSLNLDRHVNGEYSDPSHRRLLLFKRQEQYERHKSRLKAERIQQELQQCTFHPQTTSPPVKNPGHGHQNFEDHNNSFDSDFLSRNWEWMKKKENKLEMERRQHEKRTFEECTFTPQLEQQGPPPPPSIRQRFGSVASRLDQSTKAFQRRRSQLDDLHDTQQWQSQQWEDGTLGVDGMQLEGEGHNSGDPYVVERESGEFDSFHHHQGGFGATEDYGSPGSEVYDDDADAEAWLSQVVGGGQ